MLGVTWFLPLQNAVISNTPLGISTTDPAIIPVPLFSSPVGICWNLQVLPGHALSSVGIYAMSGAGATQVGELVYVPAVQLVQDPPSGPIKPLDPLLHVQLLEASLPGGDDDREGQLKHVLDVVAARLVEYLPAAQSVQDELLLFLNLPAGHS